MSIPERQQPRGVSVDQLLAELYQLIGELLLIRRPRVYNAPAAMPTPPAPGLFDAYNTDACPFCPGKATVRGQRRLVR